jgi:hypothetical protein
MINAALQHRACSMRRKFPIDGPEDGADSERARTNFAQLPGIAALPKLARLLLSKAHKLLSME